MVAEVRRVLRPGGQLHLVDFGHHHGVAGRWVRTGERGRLGVLHVRATR